MHSFRLLSSIAFYIASSLLPWAEAKKESQQVLREGPIVAIKNGSYRGLHNARYNQDLFLGIPYAKPPVGDLRLNLPKSLDETFVGTRDAKQYYPFCVGYGVRAETVYLWGAVILTHHR